MSTIMSTWNGAGTKYLGYGYRNRDGGHHATRWAVLFDMPVVPLRRPRPTVGSTVFKATGNGSSSLTQYTVHNVADEYRDDRTARHTRRLISPRTR
ncbi:hypothetical protein OG585_33615 [Streptomyces sp. NBC_01340]|uniref:hypothetical protein n=1 Tax=unclassified Streptomyces TaxID=2593676 RepID=UPI002257D1E5|nr:MULTISPECIES: hypothetical protein [unclassified Streptomyces]MCX4457518.1 hypothetical protein [Streptomyces sp. NBC_01719]WSI41750.1 hypothetical protein OG585_33615 [Streptomyces sp. NBC_01340]